STRSIGISDLHLDQSAHPEGTSSQHHGSSDQHHPTDGTLEHGLDVARLREEEVYAEDRGQTTDHIGRDLALSGQRGHLTAHVLALADGARDGVEQLTQVATNLALDLDGHHDPAEVLALEPFGDAVHGVLQR